MEEVENALPNASLVGLVRQTIATGDQSIDSKINQARNSFFLEPRSKERMRSACETLAFILEPLREDLQTFFQPKDVSEFFFKSLTLLISDTIKKSRKNSSTRSSTSGYSIPF